MQGEIKACVCSIVSGALHTVEEFSPVTRFREEEIELAIFAMESIVGEDASRFDNVTRTSARS